MHIFWYTLQDAVSKIKKAGWGMKTEENLGLSYCTLILTPKSIPIGMH